MSKTREVWVFIEQRDGVAAEVSYELLSKGRKLADQLNGTLKAIVIGHEVDDLARDTFNYGVDEVLMFDHRALKNYRTMPYSRLVSNLVGEHKPRIVLFGATVIGRDLAPRVASFTVSGLTADCTELQIADVTYQKRPYEDLLLQIRPAFGGNIIATIITPDNPVQMATVRQGVMEKSAVKPKKSAKITKLDYVPDDLDEIIQVLETYHEENRINLTGAHIIVAGGYGMGSKENFALIEQLAETIGGEVGGSRAAVDAGFIPAARQVGQTGVTVRPKLYIACGISGAIQHRAGMQEAKKIIAINNDPNAPIFEICHYGILGDAAKVIPMFIDAYKSKLK